MILTHKGRKPIIGNNVFIAPTAIVIGDVNIKDNSSIWYDAVVSPLGKSGILQQSNINSHISTFIIKHIN